MINEIVIMHATKRLDPRESSMRQSSRLLAIKMSVTGRTRTIGRHTDLAKSPSAFEEHTLAYTWSGRSRRARRRQLQELRLELKSTPAQRQTKWSSWCRWWPVLTRMLPDCWGRKRRHGSTYHLEVCPPRAR